MKQKKGGRRRDKRRKHAGRTVGAPIVDRAFSGAALKEQRELHNTTFEALALAAGTTRTTVDRWERGEGEPSVTQAWAMAMTLEVELSALFAEVPKHGAA